MQTQANHALKNAFGQIDDQGSSSRGKLTGVLK